ncbi:transposase [Acetobacter tropicalis]|uniref:Transposase n=1 Tax=Acetobacter tropicalis TaxID=104102 RepID=A0A251ZYE7_9PROT|nr:transposase [Acetobacter tropicalis]
MARALSDDLRERVLEAGAAGASARSIAARFGVGISTAIRWLRRERESGERTPRRQGKPRGSRLDAHEAFIAGMIEAQKDITLHEMMARLKSERSVGIGHSMLIPTIVWPDSRGTHRFKNVIHRMQTIL